ncbi:MAG TPA: ribonuclease Z [Pyrinomonadaceae bacterium]|nr:ribonuclease Z [Pyrinomonadaceae bacterium]
MEFIVLGSGTSIPHPLRSSSGYWLRTDKANVLLDCSASTVTRIIQEGLDWAGLDAIWISHFHLDHCGGLAPFLAGIKHSSKMKARKKRMRIFGPSGLRSLIQKFDVVNNYKLLEQPFKLEIVEIEQLEEFEIAPGLTGVALNTPHTVESHAIHIRDKSDASMVYTADTGFSETIDAFARKVGLLVIEASFPKDKPAEKHLELAETMFIIRRAEPKIAILTHLYPEWDEFDIESELAKYPCKSEVVLAYDGLRAVIPAESS